MEVFIKEEEEANVQQMISDFGSESLGSDLKSNHFDDDHMPLGVTKVTTSTGVRISSFMKQECEDDLLKPMVRIKDEPDFVLDSFLDLGKEVVPDCVEDSMAVDEVILSSEESVVEESELQMTVKEDPGFGFDVMVSASTEGCLKLTKQEIADSVEEDSMAVEDFVPSSLESVIEDSILTSESTVLVKDEANIEFSEQMVPMSDDSSTSLLVGDQVLPLAILTVKEEHECVSESMLHVKEEVLDCVEILNPKSEEVLEVVPLSIVKAIPQENPRGSDIKSKMDDSNKVSLAHKSVKDMTYEEYCQYTENRNNRQSSSPQENPKESDNKSKKDDINKKSLAHKSMKDMTYEEYCQYTENRNNGQSLNSNGKGNPLLRLGTGSKISTWSKHDSWLRDQKMEDGEFSVEADWHIVGRTIMTGISTTKGWKLVDNEIVHFSFPSNARYNSQWIVRFSTKRFGEIGRLPMEWGKSLGPLFASSKVKVLARCVAAPSILHVMQEIMLCVSFYIHTSIFTDVTTSLWKLDSPSRIDSTLNPLLALFKLLKLTPHQKAEFTPEELDSRKRSLNLEGDTDEAAAMLPLMKRRIGGTQQHPEQRKDEQTISESSLNKIIGAAEVYNLEEMEPPRTLMCELRPYQKQALYWMSESEKGTDVEEAAKTLHPCWAEYRICDELASSIYVNIFTGEATSKIPTATQMSRGGILADAMGLGKTVMTIALILARPGRGSPHNQEIVIRADNAESAMKKGCTSVNDPLKVQGGTLIVCPMALLGQWKDEIETHSEAETISVFVHYGGERTNNPRVISGHDVVLTTYGVLSAAYKSDAENSIFHKVDWYRVVLDEAHTIKSWKSQCARAAFTLSSHCRWCLTGTPLQNSLEDLYSLLCFLHVEPWCNWAWWHKMIQKPYENNDPRGLKLVKAILRPLMLRRSKDTKDKEGRPILVLPPTDVQIIECEQSEGERDFYDALFRRSKVQFDEFVAQGKILHNYANILELLLRLRQCCNHPFLVMSRADSEQYADLNKLARRFLDSNSGSNTAQRAPTQAYIEEVVEDIRRGENKECPICLEYADDPVLTPCAHRICRECLLSSWRTPVSGLCPICRNIVQKTELITCPSEGKFRVDVEKNWKESSKVLKLLESLEHIQKSGSGEKSIVFSQWTCFLDILEIPLRKRNIGFLRFDGKLSQKQREKVLKEFSETDEKMVMLMSLRAGGVGLNLTAASSVFLMDPWWNPAVEEQAIMRIHRIGQKRKVCVRRFIVKDTVEERMQQVQARKQRMIAGALTDEEVRSARIEELKMLFR